MVDGPSKWIEVQVARRFSEELRQPIFLPTGQFRDWDGINLSGDFSYEVKLDTMVVDTFNFCLEVSYRGRASGISSTAAKWWLQVVPMSGTRMIVYQFDTQTLRDAVKTYPVLFGGDGKRSGLKLLPVDLGEKLVIRKFELNVSWPRPTWN